MLCTHLWSNQGGKKPFFSDVQDARSEIPSDEPHVMFGDFNAHIGSRAGEADAWEHVRGPHGFGDMNEASKEFLNVLLLNEATICNTWFQKRNIHKRTWQHPKSKRWHCIDFAIMRHRLTMGSALTLQ